MSNSLDRRKFLQLTSSAALASAWAPVQSRAEDAAKNLYANLIPSRKSLPTPWVQSLVLRNAAADAAIQSSDKAELSRIGMTIGGIGCGTVYLSGDGQLYVWDIFNRPHEGVVAQTAPIPKGMEPLGGHKPIARERDGSNYIIPPTPQNFPNPFRQEFILQIDSDPKSRPLRNEGWKEISFTGKWPLGVVDYSDPDCPLKVRLEAWTPFIPLETQDSSLPVTVMEYTLTNTSQQQANGKLTGIWENPVLIHSRKQQAQAVTSFVVSTEKHTLLGHSPEKEDEPLPLGDWGSASLAVIGKADATPAKDGLIRPFQLQAGESVTITFILAWHFPHNATVKALGTQKPFYATRFKNSQEVILQGILKRFTALRQSTMTWVKTWNDSTLPQWLLDRSILTTNTLQTTTCHIFAGKDYPEGRFWAWEGIGCCPGTCGHVWHYAQGVARLFPSLERNLREITDYGIAFQPSGEVHFRAESSKQTAIDSQTGTILRTWREHLITNDHKFLQGVWPEAKKALEWLIAFDKQDADGLDGLLDGEQHNTLDAEWYGKVHCLCSLYLAALKAGEAMAQVMNDDVFAKLCADVHQLGAQKISTLFNGEFYIQQEDPTKLNKIGVGSGCYIDQVIGQWWAHQVGLGRIYDANEIRKALDSLWKYNFVPHIGRFREGFTRGRFYALGNEAGLVMCTWPKGGLRDDFKKHWQYGYFNECMTGFEWQVAAHLIQEGDPIEDTDAAPEMLDEATTLKTHTLRGLAISRAIHDRYHASKRNPYNEIECSDHYARANASYSVFLALCGFHYDGPKGIIGFAPKLNPSSFKAAFTAAAGWGSFEQKLKEKTWTAKLQLESGNLQLREIRLPWLNSKAVARIGEQTIESTVENGVLRFSQALSLKAGAQALTLTC